MATIITKPQTLSGHYFSKKDLRYVQQILKTYPNLSLTEIAATLCEHLHWTTTKGRNKINACLQALEKMEKLGLVTLPAKRPQKKRQAKAIAWTARSQPTNIIDCELSALGNIHLEQPTDKADIDLWKEMIDRHHYLGYRHPIGASLRYFVVANTPERQLLGCLFFSAASWHLKDRDQWVGWKKEDREQRLNLVTNNKRFLIFPWVKVPNLASHVLSLALRQLREDWYNLHGYRPVLVETFVDDSCYKGACYQAANWQCIGKTSGKDWNNNVNRDNRDGTVKSIYIYPLHSNYRAVLQNKPATHKKSRIDEDFLHLWGKVSTIIADVSRSYDAMWQKRKRVIDSLLLVFIIFRLVFSKNSQSYGTTITEFWHNCHRMKFPLPQKKPIAASAFTEARKKLDERIFKDLNSRIIQACPQQNNALWFGHRLFAVDGSKINLPRELVEAGYNVPHGTGKKHYPQGLLSCCYQLKSKIPYDFNLVSHGNERFCVDQHLKKLEPDDVAVYDRGYYAYASLNQHHHAGIHAIYRLKRRAGKQIDAFIKSGEKDKIITLMPSRERQKIIQQDYPDMCFMPLKLRLITYTINEHNYYLGTTLLDEHYTIDALKDVYHARWGIEELYKVSKQWIEVDDFHGRSERMVKQELFAHFVLITMSRLCSDTSENLLHRLLNIDTDKHKKSEQTIQVNFKNTLTTVSRHLEEIFFAPAHQIQKIITNVVHSISRYYCKTRPGRYYERKSIRPTKKWNSGWVNTP